jgi:SAM-dependent methyltransferase
MKCPVCESGECREIGDVYDDRYGYPGKFQLYRCFDCDHVFLGAGFSSEQLFELYSDYYPRSSFSLEDYRPHQERSGFLAWLDGARSSAFRWIPRSVRILDIGCGFGGTLGYHQARGCEVYGVEADQNIRRVADRFGFRVHVGLFNPDIYVPSSFDYVTLDQVMEHVQDPIEMLRGIEQVLKPGGIAILSMPNVDGWGAKLFRRRWINWHAPYHMQFFSTRSMRLGLEKTGLRLDRVVTVSPSPWLHYQWLHLLTCPPEGIPSKFWAMNGKFSHSQKVAIKLLTLVHLAKVNHLITRVFDMAGLGDNRLFFLRKP